MSNSTNTTNPTITPTTPQAMTGISTFLEGFVEAAAFHLWTTLL